MISSLRLRGGRNERGNIAVLFAVLLFPILMVVAFTIDTSRQISTSRQMQLAADTAAMAGAMAIQDEDLSRAEIQALMAGAFEANKSFSNWGVTCDKPRSKWDAEDAFAVSFETTCQFPTLLGDTFFGKETISITRTANSTNALPSLDIALMLDMSQSMDKSARLPALKTAAKDLITAVITEETGDRVRVALVPYGEAVNAGVYGNRAQGKPDDDDSDNDGAKVCVSHRENPDSAFTDAAPGTGQFVGDWSGAICRTPMIVPLSYDVAALHSEIDDFDARGFATAGHLGLAWSWYTISSNWNPIWPEVSDAVPNDEPNALKAVVMMTDGVFNRHHDYGYREEYEYSALDTMALCSNMHSVGVVIYVIGFDVEDPTRSWVTSEWLDLYGPDRVFEHCAGVPERLYLPSDASELISMYEEISSKLEIESVKLTQ